MGRPDLGSRHQSRLPSPHNRRAPIFVDHQQTWPSRREVGEGRAVVDESDSRSTRGPTQLSVERPDSPRSPDRLVDQGLDHSVLHPCLPPPTVFPAHVHFRVHFRAHFRSLVHPAPSGLVLGRRRFLHFHSPIRDAEARRLCPPTPPVQDSDRSPPSDPTVSGSERALADPHNLWARSIGTNQFIGIVDQHQQPERGEREVTRSNAGDDCPGSPQYNRTALTRGRYGRRRLAAMAMSSVVTGTGLLRFPPNTIGDSSGKTIVSSVSTSGNTV